jgi:hypothetical protein
MVLYVAALTVVAVDCFVHPHGIAAWSENAIEDACIRGILLSLL